jgi:hypothetical protein
MSLLRIFLRVCALLGTLTLAQAQAIPPREALVTSNSHYSFGPLRNKLNWKVGDSEYEGDGTLDGNLLTVNWGSSTPVVYALADDGSLRGLWAGGHGEETLTPEQ